MVCQIRKIDEAASFMEHRTCVVIILENTFCDADLRMQVINIKRLAPFARILMISAIGEETAENAVSAGVDVFLTKPFSKKTLTEAVLANVRRA
jgi:DNA-binding response OmpR family regulator